MPQTIQRGCADHDGNPQENCRYCKDLDRRLEAARDGEEASMQRVVRERQWHEDETYGIPIAALEAALLHTRRALEIMGGRSDSNPLIVHKAEKELEKALNRERSRVARMTAHGDDAHIEPLPNDEVSHGHE